MSGATCLLSPDYVFMDGRLDRSVDHSEQRMPQAASNFEHRETANSGRWRMGLVLSLMGLAIALSFYLRLFSRVQGRTDVFSFFLHWLLPAAVIHTSCFLLLSLVFKVRAPGIILFWALSAAVLVPLGGWSKTVGLILILLFGFVLVRIGRVFVESLLPEESSNWGISLSLALVFLAAGGSLLAWLHLFNWWALGLMLLIALVPDLRRGTAAFRSDVRAGWNSILLGWDFPFALAMQAMFLLGIFAYVSALAPETNSDAVRFYWPYMRLMRHYAGFFDGRYQWSYTIPQAGLIYGSAVLSLLGSYAVRLSMLLIWAALIGAVCRRGPDRTPGVRYGLAVVLASCPVVVWVASSLMLDTFVCAVVIALAVLCVEGREPGSAKFWIAVGICAGTAWAAKFSALAYAVPLVAYAAIRSLRAAGIVKTIRGLLLSAFCFIATLGPWLYHSYSQSGNPVFPFLLNIFPAPLWPRGVGFSNLDSFRLPPGWRGWLLWPIDLTFHTHKFLEGYDGKLGLALLVVLALAIYIVWKGKAQGRALAVIIFIATALLWSQTAYVRYWLPSLWLVAIAASHPLKGARQPATKVPLIVVAAFLIMMPQVLFSMINYWPSPQGWPWQVYTGKISARAYLGDQFAALSTEIERHGALGHDWPRVWFTGSEAIGHLQVQPMEATVWELTLHTLDPRSKIQYLSTAGCKYWIVNEEENDALWFRALGISHFFWNESNLIVRAGPLAVYRMPTPDSALHDFDSRAAPGTDLLLNGSAEIGNEGMPKFWLTDGEAPKLAVTPQALDGTHCMQLGIKTGMRQAVALPPGLKSVEFLLSARAVQSGKPVAFRYQIYSLGYEKDPATLRPEDQVQPERGLTGKSESGTVATEWQQFRTIFDIPDLARYVVVSIDKPEGSGEIWIDSVHLYSR